MVKKRVFIYKKNVISYRIISWQPSTTNLLHPSKRLDVEGGYFWGGYGLMREGVGTPAPRGGAQNCSSKEQTSNKNHGSLIKFSNIIHIKTLFLDITDFS